MPDTYERYTEELLEFASQRYAESLRQSFVYLCELRGWPKAQYRRILQFFRNETTPAYWAALPEEERAAQLVQWVLAEHHDAPVEGWARLDVISQGRAALAWLDEQEAA